MLFGGMTDWANTELPRITLLQWGQIELMGEYQSNSAVFIASLQQTLDNRLDTAAEIVATHMRNLINTDYPPASAVGEPPHRRTGELQAGISVESPMPLQRDVVSSAPYTLNLEYTKERPFMLRSLMETSDKVAETVLQGGDGWEGVQPFARSFAVGFEPNAVGANLTAVFGGIPFSGIAPGALFGSGG